MDLLTFITYVFIIIKIARGSTKVIGESITHVPESQVPLVNSVKHSPNVEVKAIVELNGNLKLIGLMWSKL